MAIPLILRYQVHPDPIGRSAVSVALGSFPNDARSIEGLLKLTLDPDDEVRDWAVFGLGVQGDADSPEIREEAAVGLGRRRDRRMLPALLKMLTSRSEGQSRKSGN